MGRSSTVSGGRSGRRVRFAGSIRWPRTVEGGSAEERRKPSERSLLVAAADPANAYGGLLPVPADKPYRVHRVPGNWLVVLAGRPVLGIEGGGRRLHALSRDGLQDAIRLLTELAPSSARGRLSVEEWDGLPVTATEGAELLAAAGFSRGPRQMTYRRPL